MDSPSKIKLTLESVALVSSHCIADYQAFQNGHRALYNLDFSLIRPSLFLQSEPNQKPFYPYSRDISERILTDHDSTLPYDLAISGAMYLEFLDQIRHALHSSRAFLHGDPSALIKEIEEKPEQDSAELVQRLTLLTEQGKDDQILRPAQKLLLLLQQKTLRGVGDFMRQGKRLDFSKYRGQYERILCSQAANRLERDRAKRDEKDSMFHYKMDALNVCLSVCCSAHFESDLLFVTPTVENLNSCRVGNHTFGRYFVVPLFMKNVHELVRSNYVSNPVDFLQDTFLLSSRYAKRLERFEWHNDLDQVEPHLLRQIEGFCREYFNRLKAIERPTLIRPKEDLIEDVKKALASKTLLKNRIDDLEDAARIATHALKDFEYTMGLEMLDDSSIRDDPVFQELKREFRIDW